MALSDILKMLFGWQPERSASRPLDTPRPAAPEDFATEPPSAPLGPSDEVKARGWSKDLADCHMAIQDAYPLVEAEFVAAHPDCKLKCDYTWRSKEFQFELYKKGRALQNGKWVVVDERKVVTNKDGTNPSHHQTYPAQAVDVYIMRNGVIIWKDPPLYQELGHIWEAQGLVAGATWKFKWHDDPHVQVAYEILEEGV